MWLPLAKADLAGLGALIAGIGGLLTALYALMKGWWARRKTSGKVEGAFLLIQELQEQLAAERQEGDRLRARVASLETRLAVRFDLEEENEHLRLQNQRLRSDLQARSRKRKSDAPGDSSSSSR